MARRWQKLDFTERVLVGLLAALLLIVAIVTILKHLGAFFIVLGVGVGGALLLRSLLRPGQVRKRALAKAGAVIDQYSDQLLRKRAQLVRADAYGKLQFEKWVKEVDYFVTNHMAPALSAEEKSVLHRDRAVFVRLVTDTVEALTKSRPVFAEFSDRLTPTDFELFCAEQLKLSGWDARVTLRSRDQGVDVIAEKSGVRVVLQCKLYSGPVGNKAVQEIAAGRAHEQAHYGAVVTNSRYTSAADQLAASTGVLLLHHSDLANLEKLIGTHAPR
jgi:restriction system protein